MRVSTAAVRARSWSCVSRRDRSSSFATRARKKCRHIDSNRPTRSGASCRIAARCGASVSSTATFALDWSSSSHRAAGSEKRRSELAASSSATFANVRPRNRQQFRGGPLVEEHARHSETVRSRGDDVEYLLAGGFEVAVADGVAELSRERLLGQRQSHHLPGAAMRRDDGVYRPAARIGEAALDPVHDFLRADVEELIQSEVEQRAGDRHGCLPVGRRGTPRQAFPTYCVRLCLTIIYGKLRIVTRF